MPLTPHDVAHLAGLPLKYLEDLADAVAADRPGTFKVKTVRKQHGGLREIVHPGAPLHHVARNLNRAFQDLPYRPPQHVHGFVPGRSTITNAEPHLGAGCVLRIDLEDFFPSIGNEVVESLFSVQNFDDKAASLLTKLLTIHRRLPIGLSTSPFISNLAFQATDDALASYAAKSHLTLTRYVDDLAFSPDPNDTNLADVTELLSEHGWSVNTRKTAFMRRGSRQYVTGLYIGAPDRPRLPREMKRQLRWAVHMIEHVGWDVFEAQFNGPAARRSPASLHGWACYFAAIEPELGWVLKRRLEAVLPGYFSDDEE